MVREYVPLACDTCGDRNYMTSREMKNNPKIELKKFCRKCRAHTKHVEKKRKG